MAYQFAVKKLNKLSFGQDGMEIRRLVRPQLTSSSQGGALYPQTIWHFIPSG
jgi:hypothetical protein